MSRFYAEMAEDMEEIFAELAKPVAWNGHTILALLAENELSQDLLPGGFADSAAFSIKVRRAEAEAAAIPAIGDPVHFNGHRYRVARVTNRPPHPLIILTLHDADH